MLISYIVLYLLISILIGWRASLNVKTTQDFVIAGRNLPLVVAASALFATWFGSETIMGASSEFVEHGLIGVIEDPFGAALCLFLVGFFFARPLYRLNILTFNDFFKIRFGKYAELISALFMVPSYFGWIAAQLVAMALILSLLVGLPFFAGIMICTTVVVLYTYIGGMWAVSITDFVQTILIIVGLLAISIELYWQVGGVPKIMESVPDGFFRFLPEEGFENYIHYFAAWITIGLGSIPQQDVFQRVMAAKNENTAVSASYLGGIMYLTIGFMPLFIGLCSKILYPELQNGNPQLTLPIIVMEYSSPILQVLFFGALLSAILSTTSGAMLAPATVIGENLIKPFLGQISDKKLLKLMQLSVVFVAICSAIMALLKANIYDLVAQSSALSLVSLFIPLAAGLYWRKASKEGAICSMTIGLMVWLFCEITASIIPSLIWGGLASLGGMVIGSWIWPNDNLELWKEMEKK